VDFCLFFKLFSPGFGFLIGSRERAGNLGNVILDILNDLHKSWLGTVGWLLRSECGIFCNFVIKLPALRISYWQVETLLVIWE
jgi:hypothetical protein